LRVGLVSFRFGVGNHEKNGTDAVWIESELSRDCGKWQPKLQQNYGVLIFLFLTLRPRLLAGRLP
jgi:hypothetical protein